MGIQAGLLYIVSGVNFHGLVWLCDVRKYNKICVQLCLNLNVHPPVLGPKVFETSPACSRCLSYSLRFTSRFGTDIMCVFPCHCLCDWCSAVMLKLLQAGLASAGISAYFSGHDHDLQLIKTQDDPTYYVVSGAGRSVRVPQ